jgi:hypothetical protein
MVAETISLGVLALPAAIGNLDLGAVATYTGYVIGQLKWKYPHISSAADAGQLIMGRFGRELLFWSNRMYLVFIMESHLLTFTVAMNTITKHATCSIVFGVVGLIVSFLLAIPRTLERMTWLSFICELMNISLDLTRHCHQFYSIYEYHRRSPHHHDRSGDSKHAPSHHRHQRDKPCLRLHGGSEHRLLFL